MWMYNTWCWVCVYNVCVWCVFLCVTCVCVFDMWCGVCKHVCLCVWVWVFKYDCLHVVVREEPWVAFHLFWGRVTIVHHCVCQASCLDLPAFSCVCLWSCCKTAGFRDVYHTIHPHVNSGNLNSEPHAYMARTLLTEPFPPSLETTSQAVQSILKLTLSLRLTLYFWSFWLRHLQYGISDVLPHPVYRPSIFWYFNIKH